MRPLIERGWEVYGICPPGPRIAEVERAGVRWLPHKIERKLVSGGDVVAIADLYRTLREHRFDIVHTHNAKVGLLGRVIAVAARAPIVVHTHNGLIYSLESRLVARLGVAVLERIASEIADHVFVQSRDDYDTLVKTRGTSERLLELIGNGVDLTRFDPDDVSPERRRAIRREIGVADDDVLFFSAGRIVCEKGFVELFRAHDIARRANPRIRVAIAGPADVERGLGIDTATLDEARKAGVLLLGERTDMPALYAAADVVVLPSWREGIPRVLIEGAAMGKPLIASDGRGCRNVVGPGWGYLTRLKDEDSIARALVKMAADPEERRKIGEHNRVQAREQYDIEKVIARVVTTYLRIMKEKGIVERAAESVGDVERGRFATRA
jgi:glycosyltransferase involved in cell wall biosynthesis